jgi:hypothetical protein
VILLRETSFNSWLEKIKDKSPNVTKIQSDAWGNKIKVKTIPLRFLVVPCVFVPLWQKNNFR